MNEKCTAKPKANLRHKARNKYYYVYKHKPTEAWFPSYESLTIKQRFKVSTLTFHARIAGGRLP
jgi:hypothetical protein